MNVGTRRTLPCICRLHGGLFSAFAIFVVCFSSLFEMPNRRMCAYTYRLSKSVARGKEAKNSIKQRCEQLGLVGLFKAV